MAGRKPVSKFHTLDVGESIEVKGKQRRYVYQYVYQFNKSKVRVNDGIKLRPFQKDGQQFVERIK